MIQYAAKKLSSADLTFFRCHAKTAYSATTSSIRLPQSVLVGQMYPYLRTRPSTDPVRALVLMSIYGPGFRCSPDYKTRMLFAHSVRQNTWHLTGEYVPDPDNDNTRYHQLAPSDIALFAIREAEFQPIPKYVSMVLLGQSDADDAKPILLLHEVMAEREFLTIPPATVAALKATSSKDHPLWLL